MGGAVGAADGAGVAGAGVGAGAGIAAGGVATAGVTTAADVAAGATCVSFLGTLVAGLVPGVSAGDVLEGLLVPRVVAEPMEFTARAVEGAACGGVCATVGC